MRDVADRPSSPPVQSQGTCDQAFTLIELLIVLAIMSSVFGLVINSFSGRNGAVQAVQASANELAATFGRVRARAMETKAPYTVSFHIQNDPASTGRVLNNRSGGHWYRVLRGTGRAPISAGDTRYTLYDFEQDVQRKWYENAHILPAKKVRFVALTDMDWGDCSTMTSTIGRIKSPSSPMTFPRPWFGWWDETGVAGTAGRLWSWGGYDPAISASGFYFWGNTTSAAHTLRDPEPVSSATGLPPGCANAADRYVDMYVEPNVFATADAFPLWVQGSPRPLVNASWLDAGLTFTSDGRVRMADWMTARHNKRFTADLFSAATIRHRGIPERMNGLPGANYYDILDKQSYAVEAGNFDAVSGGWCFTLGPDRLDDDDVYPTAKAALESMMPLFRVCISSFGEVRVIQVSRQAEFGNLAAFPSTESWWRTGSNIQTYFPYGYYSENTTINSIVVRKAVGKPITDFITPDMLANRSVWMK